MEKMQAAACTIGVGITVVALFGMLFPSGNIKKAGETGLTILLLFLLITPFLQLNDAESRIMSEVSTYDTETLTQVSVYENAVECLIENTLVNAGYTVHNVDATVRFGDNNTICLENLRLSVEKEADTEAALRILQNDLEIPPEIVAVQGE